MYLLHTVYNDLVIAVVCIAIWEQNCIVFKILRKQSGFAIRSLNSSEFNWSLQSIL